MSIGSSDVFHWRLWQLDTGNAGWVRQEEFLPVP